MGAQKCYVQFGGDTNAHTIASKFRKGQSPRWIAKHMGLPLAEVKAVISKLPAR